MRTSRLADADEVSFKAERDAKAIYEGKNRPRVMRGLYNVSIVPQQRSKTLSATARPCNS